MSLAMYVMFIQIENSYTEHIKHLPKMSFRGYRFCPIFYDFFLLYFGKCFYSVVFSTFHLEMPVPSQGHYGFHSFPVVD